MAQILVKCQILYTILSWVLDLTFNHWILCLILAMLFPRQRFYAIILIGQRRTCKRNVIIKDKRRGFCLFVCLMVLNATFNNISVISWRSVLLVEETGGPGEDHRPVAYHWQKNHIMLYISPWSIFELTTSVVIGTDCIVVIPTTIRSRPRRPRKRGCCDFYVAQQPAN
jgi:hypothetical protein